MPTLDRTRYTDFIQKEVGPQSRGWEKLLGKREESQWRGGKGRGSYKPAGGCGRF